MESLKESKADHEVEEEMDLSGPVTPPEEEGGRAEESHEVMDLGGPTTPPEEAGGRAEGSQETHQTEGREGEAGGEASAKPDAPEVEMEELEKELRKELSSLNDLPMHPEHLRSKDKAPKGNLNGRGNNAKLFKRPKPWLHASQPTWGKMQGDIREHKKTSTDLCNPKDESDTIITGVSPNSSDGTQKGSKGSSASKSKLGKYTIPKKVGTKHKKVKDKVASDGLLASRSKNGKLKDTTKGKEKGLVPSIQKSQKKSEQQGKDKDDKGGKSMGKEKGLVPSIQKSQKRPENKGKGGSPVERTRKSKAQAKKGDEKSCETAQNPSQQDDNKTCESDPIPAEPSKGKRKLKVFLDPEEEKEYKAMRKAKAKAKKANLKDKRRQSAVDANIPSGSLMQPAPPKATKAVSSSQPKVRRPKSSTSANKTSQGTTSQGKVSKHTMESLLPEPKKLKSHKTTREEDIEALSSWLHNDVTPALGEAPEARADLLSRHGSISFQQLAHQATVALTQDGAREVQWVDSSYQPTSAYVLAEGRLRYQRLSSSPSGRVESLDSLSANELLTVMQTPGSRVFHSTLCVDLQRAADLGTEYQCTQCGETHSVIRAPTTVILTESEHTATYLMPRNNTNPCEARPNLPRAGTGTHTDILLIPCGLQNDPAGAFEAVYGQHRGRLNVIIELGQEAVKRGESVPSVLKETMAVARAVIACRPKHERQNTRVLFPNLLLSKNGEEVVLSSWGETHTNMAVQLNLHQFNTHLHRLNMRLGHLEGLGDQESPLRWDCALYSESLIRMADEGGRMVEKVQLCCRDAAGCHAIDLQGRLHPSKMTVFMLVRRLVNYITTSADGVRWRHTEFY